MKLTKRVKNLQGNKFNKLTVLEFSHIDDFKRAVWKCLCDCGKHCKVNSNALKSGGTKSCGCYKQDVLSKKEKLLIGKRFGRLEVLEFSHKNKGVYYWKCLCDCGNTTFTNSYSLKNNVTKSCGCLQKQSRMLKKGEAAKNRFYDSYINNAKQRGIYLNISKKDLLELAQQNCFYCGAEPSMSIKQRHSRVNGDFKHNGIDRVDNSQNYSKDNCVPCCKNCNRMKNNLSKEDFINHMKKILKNLEVDS